MDIDAAKERAIKALRYDLNDDLSETDTRCKLVDAMLIDTLGWQEHSIVREPSSEAGFIDYVLHTSRPAFVIEAKRLSQQYKLPSTRNQRSFKIGGVLSEDQDLIAAINQCRSYGFSKGVSFCCVTNGIQYIFFRSHSDTGLEFKDHQAIVFRSADDILTHFSQFYLLLSFDSVSDGSNISALPVTQPVDTLNNFKALSTSSLKSGYKTRNRLFPFIRDIVEEVFTDISSKSADRELIEQCYVEPAQDNSYQQSLKALIRDRPTLAAGEVEPLRVERKHADKFDELVEASGKVSPEVVMLLGGIGVGKTTFLRRFRRVIARDRIDRSCFWLELDFNRYSDSPGNLEPWVRDTVGDEFSRNYPTANYGDYPHLKQAYHAEYERLKKGRLAPLYSRDPSAFDEKFSEEIEKFEANPTHHLTRLLKNMQQRHGRRVFLILDNADQFGDAVQNEVFMLAHRLSQDVGCTLIVSLREESYWKNKDYGVLSAFHSTNFYVEAPNVKQVIAKRFRYASELLKDRSNAVVPSTGMGVTPEEASEVFERLRDMILNGGSFVDFLSELSPGEVRRPLDQLARFLFSGHTNIDSILRGIRTSHQIKLGFHEFLKAIALGEREYFSEDKSDIVSLFGLEGSNDASNLNRLAILGYIKSFEREKTSAGMGYVPISQVIDACLQFGINSDTAQRVIQFMNARRLMETEQQGRENIAKSLFVRTTRAFDYYLSVLGQQFSYVDLLIPGSTIPAGDSHQMMERLSSQIYAGGSAAPNRIDKLTMRIDRAALFCRLMHEEAQSHSMFKRRGTVHASVDNYVTQLAQTIERQREIVLSSARHAFSRRPG